MVMETILRWIDLFRSIHENNISRNIIYFLLPEGRAMNWISIKDRLPSDSDKYNWLLVATDKHESGATAWYIARWINDKFEFWDNKNGIVTAPYCGDATWEISIKDITHWMPIEEIDGLEVVHKINPGISST